MKTVHLMGIGGSGMNSLAGLFVEAGWSVRGSDGPIYPPASDELKKLNVKVVEGYRAENLEPKPDLVVVGNVISKNNPEYDALLKTDIPYTSMAQAIAKYFIADKQSIVVAGTHGKSTTTSLMAFLLNECGEKPGYFVGGIPLNFMKGYQRSLGDYFVIEGDEYDTACFEKTPKFFHYLPRHVILTSIEFDHADIYRDLPHVKEQFYRLMELTPKDGKVIACGDEKNVREVCAGNPHVEFYGLSKENAWHIDQAQDTDMGKKFHVVHRGQPFGWFETKLLGTHNMKNTLACIAMMHSLGMSMDKVRRSLLLFLGVRRRQEFLGEVGDVKFYDDFAHHPTAIHETLNAFLPMKTLRKGRLWAIFEPRSNTVRRRVFEKVLPESFSAADEIILAPVYQKKDQLTSSDLLQPEEVVESMVRMGKKARAAKEMTDIVHWLSQELAAKDVVVFMSNGTIGGVPAQAMKRFAEKK